MSREGAFLGYKCTECHTQYPSSDVVQRCPKCNGLLDTIISPEILGEMSAEELHDSSSIWRYREFLPIGRSSKILSAGEGATPLRKLRGFKGDVSIKDETKNPTGTFKDRGASLAVTALSRFGAKSLVLSSEGNAGCSFALYAQMAEMGCKVYLPGDANRAKIELSRKLGAAVTLVDGTIADAGREAEIAAKRGGDYNASTFVTPFRHDGKGTMALEIAEQLGWKAPDWVIYPVGGGVGLVGMWKMFSILEQIGWVKMRPRFVAVQASGCAPVVEAYNSKKNDVEEWKDPKTIAYGLRIPKPLAGKWILRSLRESDGLAISVTDNEIHAAMRQTLKHEGLLLEPSSASTLAALDRLFSERVVDQSEKIVVIATGSGLKTIEQF